MDFYRALRNAKWVLLVGFLAAIVCVSLLWKRSDRNDVPAREGARAPSMSAPHSAASHASNVPPKPIESKLLSPSGYTPFIDEILVDRTEVCQNEPITVHVVAHDPRDQRRPLRVRIGGEAGNPVALVRAAPGPASIMVRVSDGAGAEDVRSFVIDVRNCNDEFQYARVFAEQSLDSDVVRFTALPIFDRPDCELSTGQERRRCRSKPEAGDAYSYEWDFGNGATLTTDIAYTEHDYGTRIESAAEATYIVKVRVRSRLHGDIEGVANVNFANTSFVNKALHGTITPYVRTSRVARKERDSADLSFDLKVHNRDELTLGIDSVEAMLDPCDPNSSASRNFVFPASAVLSVTSFPPGFTTATLKLPSHIVDEEWCSVAFKAKGTAGAYKVDAAFGSLLREAETQTLQADASDPKDKARHDRVMWALQTLGRNPSQGPVTITEDEIRALELKQTVQ